MNADNQDLPEGLYWKRYDHLRSQSEQDPFYVPTQREIREEERGLSVPVAIHSSMPVTTLLSPSAAKDYHGSLEWSAPMARRMSGVTTSEQDEWDMLRQDWWRSGYIVSRLQASRRFSADAIQAVIDWQSGKAGYMQVTARMHRGVGWLKRQKTAIAGYVDAAFFA